MPKQGEIVLIPVPFSDLSANKRRPVIVISNDEYHRTYADMVVVALTSNPDRTAFGFVIDTPDLVDGVLNRPSTVRADKIFAIAQNLAIKRFGSVDRSVVERIRESLLRLTQPI